MLRRRSRRTIELLHRDWFLCHRGADPAVIAEIVDTLDANFQTVTTQAHDGLSLTFPDYRAFINQQIDNGQEHFLVLLNRHMDGPTYRLTFGPIIRWAGLDVAFHTIRIDDCDLDGVEDDLSVDLCGIKNEQRRRREIASLCPTDRARCCGMSAA